MKRRFFLIMSLVTVCILSSNFLSITQASQQSIVESSNGVSINNPFNISESNINNVLLEIKQGIQRDKQQDSSQIFSTNKMDDAKTKNGIYDYIVLDSNYIYSYEESPNQTPKLDIQKFDSNSLLTPKNQSTVSDNVYTNKSLATSLVAAGSPFVIGDGIGGRQNIVKTGGYLSTKLHLPNETQVEEEIAAYNYSGFSAGTYEADMGLVYDSSVGPGSSSKGWKPTMVVKKGTSVASSSDLIAGYSNVQAANAYSPDSDVVLYVWHNYEGKVRMKITGTAICTDQGCSHTQKTALTTIMETASSSLNISNLDKWKLLSTVVSSANKGKNKAVYSSIKVDDNPVPSSAFSTPLTEKTTITRDANNTVTITVSG
ncbi:YrpD family protein [Paenibacillus sp. PK4536]|uniref:YrpD family protein n=1 Tax=Paenibacillus sp. PK4536 TaxID=3024576 RepID=UPI00235819BA|nr:YrpD family protein [Paenibacillus sp. PK4536]WIM40880.1 YrpD family protein [Paenibacillus sp. PK4536]